MEVFEGKGIKTSDVWGGMTRSGKHVGQLGWVCVT